MRAMWFVSDSERPTVATIGAPLPPVTRAIAPSADVLSRASSRARTMGSGSSSSSSVAMGRALWNAARASFSVCANDASRSS